MKALTAETLPYPPAVLPPEPDPKTICRSCGMVKPLSQFGSFPTRGHRRQYADCSDCRRKNLVKQALSEYNHEQKEKLNELVGAINQERTIAHITQLANTMAVHTGGFDGLCAFWWGTIQKAAEEGKWKPVLDGCNAIKNLFVEASKHEQRDKEVKHLDRAEMMTETLDFILWCAENGDAEEKSMAQTTIRALQLYSPNTQNGLDEPSQPEPVAP